MNFAPYQDDAPDSTRTSSPRPTPGTSKSSQPPSTTSTPFYTDNLTGDIEDETDFLPDPTSFENVSGRGSRFLGFGNRRGGADVDTDVDLFATSLPIRLDILALLCYVALPPVAGAVLLVLEHRSDYVRFHAWQSSLLFTFLFLIHLIFSFSKFVSYALLVLDLGLIAFLALHAYRDADSLERWEVPWIGRLASSFVDEE